MDGLRSIRAIACIRIRGIHQESSFSFARSSPAKDSRNAHESFRPGHRAVHGIVHPSGNRFVVKARGLKTGRARGYQIMAPGMPIAVLEDGAAIMRSMGAQLRDVCDVIIPDYSVPSVHNSREGAPRRYVAVFYCGDFWAPNITYVEFGGNEFSLRRLKEMVDSKRLRGSTEKCDVHVLNFDAPLSESAVCDLLTASGEALRSLLNARLRAPFSDSWKDCNTWVVRYMTQFKGDGQLALLPREPPIAYGFVRSIKAGWETSYPDRLVGFFLKEYIRAWPLRWPLEMTE